MGWFLASNKRKTRRRPSRRAHYPVWKRPKWDPKRTLRGLQWLGIAAVAIAIPLGWGHAERALIGYATSHAPAMVSPQDVSLVDAPTWMSELLKQDLRQAVADWLSAAPGDSESLRATAAALAENPWVRRLERVQRGRGGRVYVIAEYREPVALVPDGHGYRLVDVQAVRLPGLFVEQQVDRLRLPVIERVAERPDGVGWIWPGEDLRAGLSLLQLLADQPYGDQIKAVDVGARDSRGRIRLILRTRYGLVRWGLPPGMEQTIEPSTQVKLERLTGVYQSCGAIDAGGQVVDLFGGEVFIQAASHAANHAGRGRQPRVGYASLR